MAWKLTVKLGIYYGSLLLPLLFAWFCLRAHRSRGFSRWRNCAWAALLVLGMWARFIEPQLLVVREAKVPMGVPLKVALISDVHLGIYKSRRFLDQVVDRLNATDADVVMIAGDLTYFPQEPLGELFAPLRRLKVPVYMVPGNHDEGIPGPLLTAELARAMHANGVIPVENRIVRLRGATLVGLGDHWAGKDQVDLLRQCAPGPVLVLTHNPDTALHLPQRGGPLLVLAGHTHGGQLRIPFLYPRVLPVNGPFDRGLSVLPQARVFVTSGLGEVTLPLRLFNPPEIALVDLR